MALKILVEVSVEVPEGATHYSGDVLSDPVWYKVTQMGVVGDHWWCWKPHKSAWHFYGHYRPHFAKELSSIQTNRQMTIEELREVIE